MQLRDLVNLGVTTYLEAIFPLNYELCDELSFWFIQVDIDDILRRAETRNAEDQKNSATDELLSQFKVGHLSYNSWRNGQDPYIACIVVQVPAREELTLCYILKM